MRAAESGHHLVLPFFGEDGLEAELRNALLPPTPADRRSRSFPAEESARAHRVPRAALVVAHAPCAGDEDGGAHGVERLARDEDDELAVQTYSLSIWARWSLPE
jgi:hypothetical protein